MSSFLGNKRSQSNKSSLSKISKKTKFNHNESSSIYQDEDQFDDVPCFNQYNDIVIIEENSEEFDETMERNIGSTYDESTSEDYSSTFHPSSSNQEITSYSFTFVTNSGDDVWSYTSSEDSDEEDNEQNHFKNDITMTLLIVFLAIIINLYFNLK